MSWPEWFWYGSIIAVAVCTLLIGYYVDIIYAGIFWVVSVLGLLMTRPQ